MIGWFVRNRVAANLLLFGIVLSGLFALQSVPQEILPEFRVSALSIRTVFPGAGAEAVEEGILLSLEDAIRDVSGVKEISGVATEGLGVVTVEVERWADFGTVSDDIRERVESLTTLPRDSEEPVVSEFTPQRMLLRLAVHGAADERSLVEAAHLVRDRLTPIPGVAQVNLTTGRDYEISIEVSEELLTRFGLTFDQVAASIRRGSVDVPGGAVRSESGELRVSTQAEAVTAEDFAAIPLIALPRGGVVTVRDVATITDGFQDVERTARFNGEPAVLLDATLAEGARLLDTANAVHAEVREIGGELPEGISVRTWFDAWTNFESRMTVLVKNGWQGLLLIFGVLFLTLSTRLAVWTTAGLPVGFFGAFLLMPALGVTVNMFSMFAFILTLGIVVDDAIVVGENVERQLRAGGSTEAAAVRGVRGVLAPATFGVLTTMAAFTPLLGLPGIWGEIMGTLPLIVIPVLAFSLLDAAFILPHHLAHGGLNVRPSARLARLRAGTERSLAWMVERLYRPALAWSLRNRLATLALGILWLAPALGLVRGGWVPTESTPPLDSDMVTVQVSLPPGSSAQATAEVVGRIEAAMAQIRAEIQEEHGVDPQRNQTALVGQRLGSGPGGGFGGISSRAGANIGQLMLELVPGEERVGFTTRGVGDRLRALTQDLPHGAEVTIQTALLGQEGDISIRVSGSDMEELREGAESLRSLFLEYPGVSAVTDDWEGSAPELVARAQGGGAGLGIRAGEFGRQLRQALHGEEVQRIQRGRDELRVFLRHPEADRMHPEHVTEMRVRRSDGGVAPIGEVAEIVRAERLAAIQRVGERRAITVHATVDPAVASAGAVRGEVQGRLETDLGDSFPGLRFEVAGVAGDIAETAASLGRNVLFALVLVYVLLALPLSSWTQPFVIVSAVPFGLAGAIFGHAVLGLSLSITSFFGMVPLIGIVVNDALVLLDFINRKRREGLSAIEAALAAGPLRFRPIILTSVTTFAGLLPLMTEQSVQARMLIPMAASLAFGVAFATLVTLLFVPTIYTLADDAGRVLRRRG